jgi:hypothetical protein
MDVSYRNIGELIDRVRARWRRLIVLKAGVVAVLTVTAVLLVALALAQWTGRSAAALAATGAVAVVLMLAGAIRALWPARRVPTDAQVARFIEEREPSLDDRLVSAVHVAEATRSGSAPGLAAVMLADAGRRAADVDPTTIIDGDLIRRAAFQAGAALLVFVAVGYVGRGTVRRSFDALSLALVPSHLRLDVTPGHARLQAGSNLTIEARLVGNTAPVAVQLQRADGDTWMPTDMPPDGSGAFRVQLDSLADSFVYRVVAGTITSPSFEVAVVRPPRITRIDVEYRYPPTLGLEARTEEDSGDIYAPSGTDVVLRIHTDREASSGQMNLGGGASVPLAAVAGDEPQLQASLRIEKDDSYRVRVADREGMSSPGETEYFIRMLDDRPPEVRVLKPARDRSVTRLEEVDIAAEAQDDFGIEQLDLVYSVRGGTEKVVPLDIPRRSTAVTGAHTLYLEDLAVQPGDFVSYYVRARDLPRGRRSSEARSDIFFLEVKPFEQEFTLAQSQAGGGAGSGSPQLDDLVNAQKEVIVATWKLDRRAEANGAKSEPDIKAVAKAEAELKTRVEETASSFRESAMRDPRRRQPQPGTLRAGQTLPEEDAMTAAAKAMEKAVTSLDALKTKAAMPPELEALNHLLKAQSDVKDRQISRQAGTGGNGQNRQSQDLSSLFDKELARNQQTNYETPNSTEQKDANSPESMLDKIRELAQRQDELLRRQQELARQRQQMSPEELKRALETLTREQQELRQRADEMARQMSRGEPSSTQQQNQQGQEQGQQSQNGQPNQSGQQSQGGQQSQPGQQSAGQAGQPGSSGQRRDGQQQAGSGSTSGNTGNRMREVSEEMRNAASDLRREDPGQASARGSRALDKLRDLEQQMRASMPDEQRRAMGDLQLEARQLADAQRQVASELGRTSEGEAANDTLRRLAGDEERLAERVQRLQENLERQAGSPQPSDRTGASRPGAPGGNGSQGLDTGAPRQAAAEASRDLKQQRLSERMRQSAEEMRTSAGADGKQGSTQRSARSAASTQQELARSLERLADRLGAANGSRDSESKKLTDQLARAQELRDQMDATSRQLEALGQQASPRGSGQAPGAGGNDETARLREEYARQLKETQSLLDELRRDERTTGRGDGGFTFEGQGMVLSAPGTEAFKQDFAKWEELRRQATQALERAETNLSQKLQAKAAKDRLAAGVDDRPPAAYSQQVDSYFKALAGKRSR